MPKSRQPDPVTAAVPDPVDLWAAIVAEPFTPDELAPNEHTVATFGAKYGKSEKVAGMILLARFRAGLLERRRVRLEVGRHPVLAYRPKVK